MNKIKNQTGATAILITVLVLGAVMTSVLTTSEIMRVNLLIDRDQLHSTKAYFAAEAGAERVIYDIREGAINSLGSGDGLGFCNADPADFCFSNAVNGVINGCEVVGNCTTKYQEFPNNTKYSLYFDYLPGPPATTTLTSIGVYDGKITRKVQLSY